MADKMYAVMPNDLELDQAIMKLKYLGERVSLTDLLSQGNIVTIVEILQIIERMNVPLRMDQEGQA